MDGCVSACGGVWVGVSWVVVVLYCDEVSGSVIKDVGRGVFL